MRRYFLMLSAAALVACGQPATEAMVDATDTVMTETETAVQTSAARLAAVLDAQSDEHKARYGARNPAETLAFFGIEPGMAVGDALPGGGWYTKILLPYLGEDGRMVGVNYSDGLWDNFGWSEERVAARKAFPAEWPGTAREWTDTDIPIEAYTFETLPQDGSLDAFLFVRALHNLNRFENEGGFMTEALDAVHGALKPGGIVGVVQHEAPETNSDKMADGSSGYLKRSAVIAQFEAAGFELVDSSDINANPRDVPGEDDIVWRLPQSLATSREDPELRAKMEAIGESNRMTLRFRKV